jgi:hypothetical protein
MTLADLRERANIARIGEIGLACRGQELPDGSLGGDGRVGGRLGCNAGSVLA